jgi:hypothetical protein
MAWNKISSKLCLIKQNSLLKISTYVVAKKRRGNSLLAKNNNLLKTRINSPTEKQHGIWNEKSNNFSLTKNNNFLK